MSETLKPCPLCGAQATLDRAGIVCTNCDLEYHREFRTNEELIIGWNTRAERTMSALPIGMKFDGFVTHEMAFERDVADILNKHGWYKEGETCCEGCVDESKREFTNCSRCIRAGWLDYYEPEVVD